jgi:hypothetical protein
MPETKEMGGEGLPVDKYGGQTIDPTKNVFDLVTAAVMRIDDLRDAETKRVDEKIETEKQHTREIMQLRAVHEKDLRLAEAKRIDAIRVVDVNAVAASQTNATNQAAVLAQQVTTTADTLRNLVATTASATSTQLDLLTKQMTDRIAALEKTQYEGSGKEKVTDPIMQQLLQEMKNTKEAVSEGKAKSQGMSAIIGYIVLGLGALLTILNITRMIK